MGAPEVLVVAVPLVVGYGIYRFARWVEDLQAGRRRR